MAAGPERSVGELPSPSISRMIPRKERDDPLRASGRARQRNIDRCRAGQAFQTLHERKTGTLEQIAQGMPAADRTSTGEGMFDAAV